MDSLLEKLAKVKYLIISDRELNRLLHSSEILKENDTLVSGSLRILKCNKHFIVQEESNRSEIIIRSVTTLREAEKIVDERMEIYEKMWNGCGCKVRYYE